MRVCLFWQDILMSWSQRVLNDIKNPVLGFCETWEDFKVYNDCKSDNKLENSFKDTSPSISCGTGNPSIDSILIQEDYHNTHIMWVWLNSNSLIGRAKRAPHWGVQSRFCMIYVGMSVVSKMRRRNYVAHAHAQKGQFWAVKTDQ